MKLCLVRVPGHLEPEAAPYDPLQYAHRFTHAPFAEELENQKPEPDPCEEIAPQRHRYEQQEIQAEPSQAMPCEPAILYNTVYVI